MKNTIIIAIAIVAASGILAFAGFASADETKEVAANTNSTVEVIDRTADQKAAELQKEEQKPQDVHENYDCSYKDYGTYYYNSKPAKKATGTTARSTASNTTNNYEYKTEYNYTDNSSYVYASGTNESNEYNDYDNTEYDYNYYDYDDDAYSDEEGADESFADEDAEETSEYGYDDDYGYDDYDYGYDDYDYGYDDEEGADESYDYDADVDYEEIEENTWECVGDVNEAVYEMCGPEDNIFMGMN